MTKAAQMIVAVGLALSVRCVNPVAATPSPSKPHGLLTSISELPLPPAVQVRVLLPQPHVVLPNLMHRPFPIKMPKLDWSGAAKALGAAVGPQPLLNTGRLGMALSQSPIISGFCHVQELPR